MMLSRDAASLYWMGRYVERAEFVARLVEATLRLDALSSRPAGEAAWHSALTVIDADQAYAATGVAPSPRSVMAYLTFDGSHTASMRYCLDRARDNARAVRTALTREAWTAINRAWMLLCQREAPADSRAMIALMTEAQDETRGFEGAVGRMLRNAGSIFIRLGMAVERADNTARLLDVKYHLILPEGEPVGGLVDRDQWTTILQTVGAVNAYRWIYREGLQPWLVAELLILRREFPRSLMAANERAMRTLSALADLTGFQGEADRLARARHARLGATAIDQIIADGLHEYLESFIAETAAIDQAIAAQFRLV